MKKLLLAIVVLLVLVGVGSALGSGKEKGPEDKTTNPPKVASTKGKQPMKWGNWQLVGKIKVEKGFNGEFDPDFQVKNTGGESDTGTFTVTFRKGKTALGTADCTTALSLDGTEVRPGDVGPIRCTGGDDFKKGWTEITIKDAF